MMVSNCPRCQIVLGVKLSSLHGRCQIVLFCMMVSNCPRCQIVLGVKLSSLHGRCQIVLGVKLSHHPTWPRYQGGPSGPGGQGGPGGPGGQIGRAHV